MSHMQQAHRRSGEFFDNESIMDESIKHAVAAARESGLAEGAIVGCLGNLKGRACKFLRYEDDKTAVLLSPPANGSTNEADGIEIKVPKDSVFDLNLVEQFALRTQANLSNGV